MPDIDYAEQQASATWRVSPDMLCFFNGDGTFASVNPAWEATLGWTAAEMTGAPYTEFLHPDDVERSQEAFATLVQGNPVLKFENRYRHKDGEYRWLSWVAVPEGERYFCSARDISVDRANVSQIASQQAEADLREQFLAVLGHDLRNPLAAMASGISIIARRSQQEDLAPVLEQMRSCERRMDELIRNMMDFARVRLGDGIGLNIGSHADVADQLQRVVEEVTLVSPEVTFDLSNDIDRAVSCDLPRLQQVLSNLLGNAVSHGDPQQPVRILLRTTADHLQMEVANGGERLSEAALGNLFQPFFRGTPEESKQGLGLGLYIVAEIVAAHGGSVDVTSTEEETRFSVSIPT